MQNRTSLISIITTPLGFFALALLIVEGFLSIVVIGSGNTLEPNAKLTGMYMAIIAFLVIVGIVTLMVWNRPENLTLSGENWQERAKNSPSWGDNGNPITKSVVDQEPKEQA